MSKTSTNHIYQHETISLDGCHFSNKLRLKLWICLGVMNRDFCLSRSALMWINQWRAPCEQLSFKYHDLFFYIEFIEVTSQ